MRITHSMLTRGYMGNLNRNLKNLTNSNERLSSQRAFTKGWEDVSGANRALRVRAMLADNERYLNNIEDIEGRYNAVEDTMRSINTLVNNASDKLMFGANGAVSSEDREQIAKEIENLQNQVFQLSNTSYNGKYVFGASGNATGTAPFTKDANGKLLYNGTSVDDMIIGADGNPMKPDGSGPIDFNVHSYIDIGMGFKTDANNTLDPRTALRATFSGVETFGFGTTNGMPNNLYSLLGKIKDDLGTGDFEVLNKDLDQLKVQQNNLLMNVTDLGNLSTYIEQSADRIRNDVLNLQEVQNGIEAVPLSEEMMYNKDFEMAWMVTLQLGSKILPPTLFDYMR